MPNRSFLFGGRHMMVRGLRSAGKLENGRIESLARGALLTIFVTVGALLSSDLEHDLFYFSAAYIDLLFFGGFVLIIVSLTMVSGLAKTLFRGNKNSINSCRTAP